MAKVDDNHSILAEFISTLDPSTHTKPSVYHIDEVPGAFVVHDILTCEECDVLEQLVSNFVDNKNKKTKKEEVSAEETTDNTAAISNKPRRNSQHHTPCHVESSHLKHLACRLRPFLPEVAGPGPQGANQCHLDKEGFEVSTFLRCYRYSEGDYSTPHYDRSQYEYEAVPEEAKATVVSIDDVATTDGGDTNNSPPEAKSKTHNKRPPCKLIRFSAFSIVIYLNDDFEGGTTTFLSPVSTIT
jgi:hypothetical protein